MRRHILTGALRGSALLVCLLCAGVASSAHAHGPAPAVLEVLTVSEPPRPDLIRSNVGLLLAEQDGTYRYGCPSQWGGLEAASMAATRDRGVVAAIGAASRLYLSLDAGCHFIDADEEGRWVVQALEGWEGFVWVLAREREVGALADWVLLAVDGAGALHEAQRWPGEGLALKDLMGWRTETGGGLLVSGVEPGAVLWIGALVRDGDWALSGERMQGLPTQPLVRLSLRAVDDRELWLLATQEEERRLWQGIATTPSGLFEAGAPLEWSTEHPAHEAIHGPVWFDERWIAVFDGQTHTRPGEVGLSARAWDDGEVVDWTCLQRLDATVFACTLQALRVLEPGGESTSVFTFSQLGPPSSDCPSDLQASLQCQGDWLHFGGESGWADRDPQPHPDGADVTSAVDALEEVDMGAPAPLDVGEGDGDCSCRLGTPRSGRPRGGAWALLVGFAWWRQRRVA